MHLEKGLLEGLLKSPVRQKLRYDIRKVFASQIKMPNLYEFDDATIATNLFSLVQTRMDIGKRIR